MGGLGHNRPPEEIPITEDERDEALRTSEEIKSALREDKRVNAQWLQLKWQQLQPLRSKLGAWVGDRITEFFSAGMPVAGAIFLGGVSCIALLKVMELFGVGAHACQIITLLATKLP
jgi:hypothetical protein